MLSALLVLGALLHGAQPTAAASPPEADPAARMALGSFAFGCMERLSAATSAADYAAKSQQLGDQLKAQYPEAPLDKARLEGVGGDGCRVTYRGVNASVLWGALSDFSRNKMNNPCTEQRSADRAALTCAANANPAYDEVVERRGAGPDAQVTASIIYRGPAIPSGSSAVIPAH